MYVYICMYIYICVYIQGEPVMRKRCCFEYVFQEDLSLFYVDPRLSDEEGKLKYCACLHLCVYICEYMYMCACECRYYGVATISRMLKNIGLFCKRDLQKRPIFCKETYIFKHPTNRSHPIFQIQADLSLFYVDPRLAGEEGKLQECVL